MHFHSKHIYLEVSTELPIPTPLANYSSHYSLGKMCFKHALNEWMCVCNLAGCLSSSVNGSGGPGHHWFLPVQLS